MVDFSQIYAPLDKGSCIYFFLTTIFFFVVLVVAFFYEIFMIFKDFKNLTRGTILKLLMLFNIFIAYFVNRLLYTMCNKSLA